MAHQMATEATAEDPGSEALSALLIRGQLQRIAEEYERMHAQHYDLLQENNVLRETLELFGRIQSSGTVEAQMITSKEPLKDEGFYKGDLCLKTNPDQLPCELSDPLADICLSEHNPLNVVDVDTRHPVDKEVEAGTSVLQVLRRPSLHKNRGAPCLSTAKEQLLPRLTEEKIVDLDAEQEEEKEYGLEEDSEAHLPLHISEGNRSIASSLEGGFPRWFDPGSEGGEMVTKQMTNATVTSRYFRSQPENTVDCGTLAPLSKTRLSWDAIAFLCLLVELWVTPVELIYLEAIGTPDAFKVTSNCITVFFAVDILLNFNTGYIAGDRTILHRRSIIKNYLQFWFWVDVIATVPFDLLVETVSGSMFSMARVGKASKVLKTLRYLKMLRAFRLVKTMQQAGNVTRHLQILNFLRFLVLPAQVLTFLLLFAHTHGIIRSLLQPSVVADAVTELEAYGCYFDSFAWAFLALTAGTLDDVKQSSSSAILVLEMVIACERLILFVVGSQKVVFHVLCFIDDARKVHVQKNIVEFLRDHQVSYQTQIQVLFNMKGTTEAQKHQDFYDRLWNSSLPIDLRREIAAELWVDRLSSLGLIAQLAYWNQEFVVELAQRATEQVLPSRVTIFEMYEPALEAYFIIKGELKAARHCSGNDRLLNFVNGMWVGENALVSSRLRYSATFITKKVTSLMSVKGESFQGLISDFAMMADFEAFCSEHLWKGLCGRCGSIGSHFSDTCQETRTAYQGFVRQKTPIAVETSAELQAAEISQTFATPPKGEDNVSHSGSSASFKATTRTDIMRNSVASAESQSSLIDKVASAMPWHRTSEVQLKKDDNTPPPLPGGDLQRLLKENGLLRILPSLLNINVHNLDRLESVNSEAVNCQLAIDGFVLSQEEQRFLTQEYIKEFRKLHAERAHSLLFKRVSRLHHLIFLSHYKVEAGTEAALMRTELEQAIAAKSGSLGNHFDEPIFLDSDNLQNLEDLVQRVRNSHNLALLLTQNVLSRPWVLVEIITAKREGVRVIPVIVSKPGSNFVFPDDAFYARLRDGSYVGEDGVDVIRRCGYTLEKAEEAVRWAFQQIAVPYSPHKATGIRQAEINALLKSSKLKKDENMEAKAAKWRGSGSKSTASWWSDGSGGSEEPYSPTTPKARSKFF